MSEETTATLGAPSEVAEAVPQQVEPIPVKPPEPPRGTQVAEVISAASLPELWSFQIAYRNDDGVKIFANVFFGKPSNPIKAYPLWESPTTPVAVQFQDYYGDILVYPPNQVIHAMFTGTTPVNPGSIYRHLYK